jgi:LmbE family N-acetylglucosaminyl deacetylase
MNTETKKEQLDDIAVVEEKDGSVTVDLPDHIESPDVQASDEQQDDSGDVDHPDDTDAVREARRNRRRAKKEYIKRTNEEKDQRLGLLTRQNQELMERLSVVERKTHGADLARFEKAIEDEEYRFRYAQQKMQEATDNSDGQAFTKAQELWYDSRRKLEAMNNYKEQAAKTSVQDTAPANPKLVRLANSWMERNSWYDPEAGDEDTQIAKVIDNRLVSEGWDPATEDYWDELDNRLQKRLPHRYTRPNDENSRRTPRSVVTGSSRESVGRGNGNTFVLEPEQVRAMKDAGFWDDAEKRNRMIKRYALEARTKRS